MFVAGFFRGFGVDDEMSIWLWRLKPLRLDGLMVPLLHSKIPLPSPLLHPKVVGSRLHYKKRSGNGPAMGWVSILAGGKRLLEEASEHEPWKIWKGSPEQDLRDVFKNGTPSGDCQPIFQDLYGSFI